MRLLHTSDWQLGKPFGLFDGPTREVLRAERLDAVSRLGQLACDHGASAVLVAGDIYDAAMPADRTLRQPIERMRQFPGVKWHLVPGNHDPHAPSGPWERLLKLGLPDNVVLHATTEPAPVGNGAEAWVVPAVLTRRHSPNDPTMNMDDAATPDGVIRIGLAHGSVTEFGNDPGSTHNLIAPDRADRASLAYLALGDWHGARSMGPRTGYSGTPEIDDFNLGGRGGGEALLVEIDGPRALPTVTHLRTGRFAWRREDVVLDNDDAVSTLAARLRGLHNDPSSLLLWLRVSGIVSMLGAEAFERDIRDGLGGALRSLRVDDGLVVRPSAGDIAALARTGSVGAAAERLACRADDAKDPQRVLARDALRRLHALHVRHERGR